MGAAGMAGSSGEGGAPVTIPIDTDAGTTPTGTPVFVAAGYGGRRMRSLDGMAWTDDVVIDPNGGDDENLLRGIGFGGGLFLAVGGSVFMSTDGATWELSEFNPDSFISDAVYSDGIWVIAGGNGLLARSIDGAQSWIDMAPYYAGHYRDIAAGNGVFVAVGHTYGDSTIGLITTSTDGSTWTEPQTAGESLSAIGFGNSVFVAVGALGRVSVSADGVQWADTTYGAENRGSVSFVDGEFVIPNAEGLAHAIDGQDWQALDGTAPSFMAYAAGTYAGFSWGSVYYGDSLATFTRMDLAQPSLSDLEVGYLPDAAP
jgi:hypothetical protein